jgi:uncharacterized Zn-binding protein involved in type VI secretion
LLTASNRTDWAGLPAARVADSMRCLTACKFKGIEDIIAAMQARRI